MNCFWKISVWKINVGKCAHLHWPLRLGYGVRGKMQHTPRNKSNTVCGGGVRDLGHGSEFVISKQCNNLQKSKQNKIGRGETQDLGHRSERVAFARSFCVLFGFRRASTARFGEPSQKRARMGDMGLNKAIKKKQPLSWWLSRTKTCTCTG